MLYTADVEKSLKAEVDGLRAVRAERNAEYMAEVRAKRWSALACIVVVMSKKVYKYY